MQSKIIRSLSILSLLASFSSPALIAQETGAIVQIFDKDISLPSTCKLYIRPSLLDGKLNYWCDLTKDGVWRNISFYKNTADSNASTSEKFEPNSSAQATLAQLNHFRFMYPKNEVRQTIIGYELCDQEVCMRISSTNESGVREIISQVTDSFLESQI